MSIHDPSCHIIVASHWVHHSPLLHPIYIYFCLVSSSRLFCLIQFWESRKTTMGLAPPPKWGKIAGHSLWKGVPYVHSRQKSPTEERWHKVLFCTENCGTQCTDSCTYCDTCANQDRCMCISSTIYLLFLMYVFQDTTLMGRLISIPYFFSATAFDHDKGDTAALRKAKKEASEGVDEENHSQQSSSPVHPD